VGFASPARAELHESVDRLAEAWRAVGASVVVDKTRFLQEESDDRRPVVVVLPELPEGECTTVVLMGPRGLGFHVRVPGASASAPGDDPDAKRIPSAAGAVFIERCSDAPLKRLVVASDSGRGALETVVARSSKPLPPLRTVLPERSGGLLLPVSEAGTLPPMPAPEKRAEVVETRARRDGASVTARSTIEAGVDGSGVGEATLPPGCHTLELFAVDPRVLHPSRRGKLDLDAEMRESTDDRLMARDRTDAPDAQLSVCVGESTHVGVTFAGAPPGSQVLVTHAAWSLPEHLPTLWGTEAMGRMAKVLLARHVTTLPGEPVQVAQGGYGMTPVPLSLEPGSCYLAVVGLSKESARSLGLVVRVGTFDATDDRGIDDAGAAVAFCAGQRTAALATVEARGTPLLGWGLSLYRLQTAVWQGSP
jgi:mRNA-degrading endonuclease toxin of MazEF toxin-antitoxin module